jgi:hypothetical protein
MVAPVNMPSAQSTYVAGMSLAQVLVIAVSAAIPAMLLLLPAVHGCVCAAGGTVATKLLEPFGVTVPPLLARQEQSLFAIVKMP